MLESDYEKPEVKISIRKGTRKYKTNIVPASKEIEEFEVRSNWMLFTQLFFPDLTWMFFFSN